MNTSQKQDLVYKEKGIILSWDGEIDSGEPISINAFGTDERLESKEQAVKFLRFAANTLEASLQ